MTIAKLSTNERSPLTASGMAAYPGILAAVYEITVTGVLPKGNTTKNVTYFIVDANNTIVGQILLPDASEKYNSVSIALKVSSASAPYSIGTFDDRGFHPSNFLSVRNPVSNQGPRGA